MQERLHKQPWFMKTPLLFIAIIIVCSLLLDGCSHTARTPDVTGNWSIKDTASSATGTMTLKESADHTTLKGSMDMMGTQFALTGTIDASGSVNLKGKSQGDSLQLSGTVKTPTTMKLTADEEGVVNPDAFVVTKISK